MPVLNISCAFILRKKNNFWKKTHLFDLLSSEIVQFRDVTSSKEMIYIKRNYTVTDREEFGELENREVCSWKEVYLLHICPTFCIPACAEDLTLPDLPNYVACHISEVCTSVQCCLEVEPFQTSAQFYIELDACELMLTVGIEKLKRKIDLKNYNYGMG